MYLNLGKVEYFVYFYSLEFIGISWQRFFKIFPSYGFSDNAIVINPKFIECAEVAVALEFSNLGGRKAERECSNFKDRKA